MAKLRTTIPRWLKINGEKWYLNSEKTAEFFEVSTRTLANWNEKANRDLKQEYGWWDLKAIMEWRNGENEETDLARKLKAEADLKEEQATKAKRENEILDEKYLPAEEVHSEWARRVSEVKSGLLAMSKKVAGQFSDPDIRIEIEKILQVEVFDLLSQYARTGKYTPKAKATKRGGKKKM